MVRTLGMTRRLWLLAAVLALGAGYECLRIREAVRFNEALRKDDLATASAFERPSGELAAALAAQRKGEFDAAHQAYAAVAPASAALRAAVRFNLANLYLRRALELEETAGGDVVGPLIELAKQEYREVLRADSSAWDAKYNLELALSVQPDVGDVEDEAVAMPEHSENAIATQRKFERLP